jgi:hypothetical protein
VTAKVKVTRPNEETIAWFVKHVGPRTHYTAYSIGGNGWRFTLDQDNPYTMKGDWYLSVDDEKYLSYYLLVK